ncbi:MAG: MurR/RpiR family transcriptional regulator [Eubacteriales bacterium]|nr:MurR/RpiR family transcriptional regulator [Eubacteriales bacterium]
MEKIIDRITRDFGTYTNSHKAVATYILANYDESAFMTLEQLSSSAGVSTTTVIRFARELGYDGYSSMQDALRIDLRTKVSLPERLDYNISLPNDELLKQVLYTEINNIEQTFKSIDMKQVEKAVQLISSSDDVYIVGLRRSFSLASYTYSRLAQAREKVRLISSIGINYPEEIVNASEYDVCIAFLFPRYSQTTLSILNYFKTKGVGIILITSLNHIAIDKYADIILPCETSCISGKTSYVAPLSLINYMMALYIQENKATAREMLNKTEDVLSSGVILGLGL